MPAEDTNTRPVAADQSGCSRRTGASADETKRPVGRWVIEPGPDGQERLALRWQVVGPRQRSLHEGAEQGPGEWPENRPYTTRRDVGGEKNGATHAA
jgi:hypothetical protein